MKKKLGFIMLLIVAISCEKDTDGNENDILGNWSLCVFERIIFPSVCNSVDENENPCGGGLIFKQNNELDAFGLGDGSFIYTKEGSVNFMYVERGSEHVYNFSGTTEGSNLIIGSLFRDSQVFGPDGICCVTCSEGWRAELRR